MKINKDSNGDYVHVEGDVTPSTSVSISVPALVFNYKDNVLESIFCGGELFVRQSDKKS